MVHGISIIEVGCNWAAESVFMDNLSGDGRNGKLMTHWRFLWAKLIKATYKYRTCLSNYQENIAIIYVSLRYVWGWIVLRIELA